MSSRSSSKATERLLTIGRVKGHRGRDGEITVLVNGDAGEWASLRRVVIEGRDQAQRVYEIRESRGYRDRLVLRLEGVDDGDRAAQLRGSLVKVAVTDAPELPEGNWYRETLEGMRVVDESGETLGRVRDVVSTGGTDLLVVDREDGNGEALIPLARSIVLEIDENARELVVRPPEGLLTLNDGDGGDRGR